MSQEVLRQPAQQPQAGNEGSRSRSSRQRRAKQQLKALGVQVRRAALRLVICRPRSGATIVPRLRAGAAGAHTSARLHERAHRVRAAATAVS